jgi:hypothetical protein
MRSLVSVRSGTARCPLVSILSAFVRGTPPMRLADYGEQAARATGLCPRMTAFVRLWPQEVAKASSALADKSTFCPPLASAIAGEDNLLDGYRRALYPS